MLSLRNLLFGTLILTLPLTGFQTKAKSKHKHKHKSATAITTPVPPTKPAAVEITESLSGLDLIPNRHTGIFAVRIAHRLTQPATFRLIDTKTSKYLRTELLEPGPAVTRALQIGKLPYGEYKMEVLLPDTVYWKTVRVRK